MVQVSRVKTPQKPDGSLVLKRCAPREDGFIDCKPVVRAFLEATRVQETVAAKPDAHWAPVRERGEDEDGGYYLTDYYPGSAQKLIVGKFRLSGPGLLTLVRAVLSGLFELKEACGRHHGNLKATNVLIAGTDEVEDRDVFLTDPADSSKGEANDGGADDLFQLGQLIHQLVLHRTFRPVTGWPVEPSEAWSRLGYAGNRWRDFCNHLLHPDPLARPASLDEARSELARIGRRPLAFTLVRWAAAAVILAGIGVGSWLYVQHRRIRDNVAAFEREWNGWFEGFTTVASRNRDIRRDEYLKREVVPAVDAAGELPGFRSIGTSQDLIKSPPTVFDRDRRRQLEEAVDVIRRAQQALWAWEFPQSLARRQEEFEKLGWKWPAEYLAWRLDRAKPVPGTQVGTGVAKLAADKENLKKALEEIDAVWASVQRNVAAIAAAKGSEFPRRFATEYVTQFPAQYKGKLDDTADLRGFVEHLKWLDEKTRGFAAHVGPGWSDDLSVEALRAYDSKLGPENFEAWLAQLPKLKLQRLPEESVRGVRGALEDTGTKLVSLETYARDDAGRKLVAQFAGRRRELEGKVKELAELRYVQGDASVQKRLTELAATVNVLHDGVANELTRQSPEPAGVWKAAQEKLFDGEDGPVRDGWRRLVATVAGSDVASLAGARYVGVRDEVAKWAAALRKVPPAFPPPPAAPDEAFAAAMSERRAAALSEAVGLWERSQKPPEGDDWLAPARQAYEAWLQDVRSLADRYQSARELLDAGATLDAKAPTGQTLEQLGRELSAAAPDNAAVAARLAAVVREIQGLRQVEEQIAVLRGETDQLAKKDELAKALARCDDILKLRPGDRDAQQRKADLAGRITRRTAELLEQAGALLKEERYDAALAALKDAESLAPRQPAVDELRRAVAAARAKAQQARGAAALVQSARVLVDQGKPQEALAQLRDAQGPEAAALAEEIRRLVAGAAAAARQGDLWFDDGNHRDALPLYQEAMRGGSAHAMYRLGVIYRAGRGVAPHPESSGLVLAAAELGDPEAMSELARALPPNRPNRWASALFAATQQGDPAAQFLYGDMLESGEGVPQSLERAIPFYRNAANKGHPEAMFRLARMYEAGQGLPKDPRQARSWYEKASSAGHPDARRWVEQQRVASNSRTAPPQQPPQQPKRRNGWLRDNTN
jgi:TPR repeat protein